VGGILHSDTSAKEKHKKQRECVLVGDRERRRSRRERERAYDWMAFSSMKSAYFSVFSTGNSFGKSANEK
jgi:hypothetical protein